MTIIRRDRRNIFLSWFFVKSAQYLVTWAFARYVSSLKISISEYFFSVYVHSERWSSDLLKSTLLTRRRVRYNFFPFIAWEFSLHGLSCNKLVVLTTSWNYIDGSVYHFLFCWLLSLFYVQDKYFWHFLPAAWKAEVYFVSFPSPPPFWGGTFLMVGKKHLICN